MREAFPSLPSGSPELEKRQYSGKQSNIISGKDGKNVHGRGSGASGTSSGGTSSASSSLKRSDTHSTGHHTSTSSTPTHSSNSGATGTPQIGKSRKSTTTKLGHQQSLHNTKYTGNSACGSGSGASSITKGNVEIPYSDYRDNISALSQCTVSTTSTVSDSSDGKWPYESIDKIWKMNKLVSDTRDLFLVSHRLHAKFTQKIRSTMQKLLYFSVDLFFRLSMKLKQNRKWETRMRNL